MGDGGMGTKALVCEKGGEVERERQRLFLLHIRRRGGGEEAEARDGEEEGARRGDGGGEDLIG